MKKKLLLSICGIACISLTTLASCGTPDPIKPDPIIIDDPVSGGVKLCSHGLSEYTIVCQTDDTSSYTSTAAAELQTLFEMISGARMEVVFANKTDVSGYTKYISLGDTPLATVNEVAIDSSITYGDSGYYLKTKDNNIYVLGDPNGNGEGIAYGVYKLLNKVADFKAYALDELHYEKKDTIYVPNLDESYVPSFETRELGYKELIDDKIGTLRLHLINKDTDPRWGLHGHTMADKYFRLINYETYFDPSKDTYHPKWYSDAGAMPVGGTTQIKLCYTARGDEVEYSALVNEMATNMLNNYILLKPNATYFMMGQADCAADCGCPACLAKANEYNFGNGAAAGLQMLFLNDVIERIDELIDQSGDEELKARDIQYYTFAYQGTLVPPEGNRLVPNPKLHVEFTPIGLDYSKDMHSVRSLGNQISYQYLLDWYKLLGTNLMLYTYDVNFKHMLTNFPNFESFKENALDFANNGISYYYSQGAVVNNVSSLTYMRIFVESEILWDANKEYEALVDEFMQNYFFEAGDAMKEYYDIIRNRYAYFNVTTSDSFGDIYYDISKAVIYTKGIIDMMDGAINKALSAIEQFKTSQPEYYEKLYYRIKKEYICVLFLYLTNYRSMFSDSKIDLMLDEFHSLCDHFNIIKCVEGADGLPF